jgi:amino acid adenylation domain-containing protein
MNKQNIEAIYPLTPMQKGMVFHSLYDPDSRTYNEAMTCVLKGKLDISAFKNAWKVVIDEYAILRTAFSWKKLDRMLQIVYKDVPIPLEVLDWSSIPKDKLKKKISEYIENDRKSGFDLSKPPLLKLTLILLEKDTYQFIWQNHHVLLDGWSVPLVILRVLSCYELLIKGINPERQELQPFSNYVKWLDGQDLSRAENYWVNELAGFQEPVTISQIFQNNDVDLDLQFGEIEIQLDEKETQIVNQFCRENQLTQSTIIQGAWGILLGKYNHVNDVVFGVTVSGRPAELPNVESMVGLFINTLPLRVVLNPDSRVIDWLKNIQAKMVESRQYEYSPLYEIQSWSDIPAGTALFDSILIFENYPVERALEEQSFSLKIDDLLSFEQTNYPINIISSPGDRLPVKISFDMKIFDKLEIEKILKHLKTIILGFVNNPLNILAHISMIDEEEENKLLEIGRNSGVKANDPGCVHQLFEQIADKYPHQIAVKSPEGEMTYEELNLNANKLAKILKKRGVGVEDKVGICVNKSNRMILALLGSLKAGGVYIPLDPSYPQERLIYMLKDGDVKLLITEAEVVDKVAPLDCEVLLIDQEWATIQKEEECNLETPVKPENLVYIIYTSGSTGQPKGAMIEHHSLENYIKNQVDNYSLSVDDRSLQFLSFSFDAAGAEIFPTLCSGGTLVIPGNEFDLSTDSFLDLCKKEAISIVHLPTSYWHEITNEIERRTLLIPENLRLVEVGGESPAADRLLSWVESLQRSGIRNKSIFINSYGPTETTITAIDFKIDLSSNQINSKIPIGKPIKNVNVYILDQFLHLSPMGVPGELVISGEGVGRGYHNRDELTAERFVENIWNPGQRLYRTGDIARYLPDGNVEFIGRKDNQVKIRGFRIEMDEIESAVLAEKQVWSAVITAPITPTGRRLVAYIVPNHHDDFDLEKFQYFLRQRLPEYMIPLSKIT